MLRSKPLPRSVDLITSLLITNLEFAQGWVGKLFSAPSGTSQSNLKTRGQKNQKVLTHHGSWPLSEALAGTLSKHLHMLPPSGLSFLTGQGPSSSERERLGGSQ